MDYTVKTLGGRSIFHWAMSLARIESEIVTARSKIALATQSSNSIDGRSLDFQLLLILLLAVHGGIP